MTALVAAPIRSRILIVDDDTSILRLAARALPEYELVLAHFPAEAVALGQGVDLVITDYMMPEMTGDTLVGYLRERNPRLKALFITAHADILDGERPAWWTAEAHLAKPFSVGGFRRLVEALVVERFDEAASPDPETFGPAAWGQLGDAGWGADLRH